jgi:hypothetical protein
VCDGLQLQRVLLCMMRRENLIEDDEGAVAVAGGQDQALSVGRPSGTAKKSAV